MAVNGPRTKCLRRRVKRGSAKFQRRKQQKNRLIALGVPEGEVAKMNSQQIRRLLLRPVRLVRRLEKQKPAAAVVPAQS